MANGSESLAANAQQQVWCHAEDQIGGLLVINSLHMENNFNSSNLLLCQKYSMYLLSTNWIALDSFSYKTHYRKSLRPPRVLPAGG